MFEAAAVRAALRVLRVLRTAGLALLVLAAAGCGTPAPRAGRTTVDTCAATVLARHDSDGRLAAMVALEQADEDPDGHPGVDVILAAARGLAPGLRVCASVCPGPTGVASTHVVLRAQAARGPPA